VNNKTDVAGTNMNREFIERLHRTFDNASMADVARRLKIPHATVRNYYQGRLPAPEVLIKIANETGVSLNWLLTGNGDFYASLRPPIGLGRFVEEKIEEMIDKKLAAINSPVQELGVADKPPEFDVAAALEKHDDPQKVMNLWFAHEGREYPQDFGVVFFQGWGNFTVDEKVEAVYDAKRVLDRSLKT
jgi:transcriptional regulator with XRE-family HTH domain